MQQQPLTEGVDFYYNEAGYVVLTATYLLNRGFCCGNGCKHCPYAYEKVPEPKRTALLTAREENEKKAETAGVFSLIGTESAR